MEPRKSNRKILWIIAALIFTLVGLVLCGGYVSAMNEAAKTVTPAATATGMGSPEPTSTASLDAEMQKALGELDKQLNPSPSKTPKRSPEPSPIISGDDLVHVGEDIPAGTYRAIDRISNDSPWALCYWSKTRDAEGSNIIDNGIPTGGRPQVTLKKGQWFKSQGCPDWRKQ